MSQPDGEQPDGDQPVLIDEGWDSRAFVVDGVWLDREPRRPEIVPRLLAETTLLPWLSPKLPLAVPEPRVLVRDPLRVRHRIIPGEPTTTLSPLAAETAGRFLAALHSVGVQGAVERGVPDADAAFDEHLAVLGRFRSAVLPLLPEETAERGAALLDRLRAAPSRRALVHADVGPAHLLSVGGMLSGVIDWSDAHIGDPAMDLAWPVFGSGAGASVSAAYGADPDVLARAQDWHRLGPWHEVLYGIDRSQQHWIDSGVSGVRDRLATGGQAPGRPGPAEK